MRKSRNVSTIQTAKCVLTQFQWCTTGDQTNASISVHIILWKKQGVRFWGTWKGCTDLPPMVVWHSREDMEEQIQVHWSPMFPHTDSRNHMSVLMIFHKDSEYPCWDGLQLLCDWVCAFQKPTHSIPWNAKKMGSYFYIILTAGRIKNKHGTNLLNKSKITAIL